MNDAERRTMDLSHLEWSRQERAVDAARAAIQEYVDSKYYEYLALRGCSPEAAYTQAREMAEHIFGQMASYAVMETWKRAEAGAFRERNRPAEVAS